MQCQNLPFNELHPHRKNTRSRGLFNCSQPKVGPFASYHAGCLTVQLAMLRYLSVDSGPGSCFRSIVRPCKLAGSSRSEQFDYLVHLCKAGKTRPPTPFQKFWARWFPFGTRTNIINGPMVNAACTHMQHSVRTSMCAAGACGMAS